MKNLVIMLTLSLVATVSFAQNQVTLTKVVQNDEQENLLADSFGKMVYTFDLDNGATVPQCVGDCAEVWPAYIVTAEEAKTLVSPLGTVARSNGKLQVTYNGKPLYTYIFDRQVGDDHGDGIGGVWHYIEVAK